MWGSSNFNNVGGFNAQSTMMVFQTKKQKKSHGGLANTNSVHQHAVHTSNQMSSGFKKWWGTYQKAYVCVCGGGRSRQDKGPTAEKEDRKWKRTRQNNKRACGKVESNDSPQIPDRGKTLDILGGGDKKKSHQIKKRDTTCPYAQCKLRKPEELVPAILPLLKEYIRLGHAGIVNHSI